MTALAQIALVASALSFLLSIVTLLGVWKAYRLNKASRATYEAAYNTLEEAAGLVNDARNLYNGIADGSLRA